MQGGRNIWIAGAALLLAALLLLAADPAGVAYAAEAGAETGTAEAGAASPYGPAPQLTKADYPTVRGVNARIAVWLAAQMHLWFAAFVLAVPIFVFIIEAIGMKTRDQRYDDMAYEFIKVSITAYSLTAILGGLLVFCLVIFYPHLWGYLVTIFKDSMFYYALLFFAESAFLYLYYYGWHWLQGGNRKWVHLTIGLLLNAAGTLLMFLANRRIAMQARFLAVRGRIQRADGVVHLVAEGFRDLTASLRDLREAGMKLPPENTDFGVPPDRRVYRSRDFH